MTAAVETLVGWLVPVGAAVLALVVITSWLSTYGRPRSTPVGASLWFALPSWLQIGGGLAAIVVLTYAGYLAWIPLPLALSPSGAFILEVTGLATFMVGLSLALWARRALGGMYGVSTGGAAQLRVRHQLIRHGPYAFVRHPMYLGYWLLLAGVLLIYRTWAPLILLAMLLPSFYRRASREEAALAEAFPAEWQAYAEAVPMFLPRWRRHAAKTRKQ